MNIVLYQPDIPQNTGAFVRLAACLGAGLHIIEPAGFILDDRKLSRVALDYGQIANITRHVSFDAFMRWKEARRLILLSTKASLPYTQWRYEAEDLLMVGRESSGVPDAVHEACDARVMIPMASGARSLNVVNAASMVLGEAMRQTIWKM